MSEFCTVNKKIACKPSEKHSMEAPKVRHGFAMTDDRQRLFVVETLFRHACVINGQFSVLPPGTKLHLPSDAYTHEWNRRVLNREDGSQFILVPEELIIAIETV